MKVKGYLNGLYLDTLTQPIRKPPVEGLVRKEASVVDGQHVLQDLRIISGHSFSLLLLRSLVLLICGLFGHFKKLK